jgi:hypothetical protein
MQRERIQTGGARGTAHYRKPGVKMNISLLSGARTPLDGLRTFENTTRSASYFVGLCSTSTGNSQQLDESQLDDE